MRPNAERSAARSRGVVATLDCGHAMLMNCARRQSCRGFTCLSSSCFPGFLTTCFILQRFNRHESLQCACSTRSLLTFGYHHQCAEQSLRTPHLRNAGRMDATHFGLPYMWKAMALNALGHLPCAQMYAAAAMCIDGSDGLAAHLFPGVSSATFVAAQPEAEAGVTSLYDEVCLMSGCM